MTAEREPGVRRSLPVLDLQPVIDTGSCIGCGACVAVDPTVRLQLDDRRQSWVPSHASGAEAAAVCPAVGVDFERLHELRFPGSEVGPHGVVESVHLAQSTDLERNRRASSGGLIKEVLASLLRSGEADGVISLVHQGGIDFNAGLVRTEDEVNGLPGSIYHAVPFDRALALLRENEGRFVLVAIPCQLEGIFTHLHRNEPELLSRLVFTVGLLCGWQYTHHALRAIGQYKGADVDAVTDITWRGDGPVGKLRLTTPDGVTEVSRRVDFSYQVAFDRSFNIPRCHTCINHSNFLADLVVGDAWLPSTVFTKTGISLVVCRTAGARAVLERLHEQERVVATEVTTDEITESQTRRVVFGDFAYAYQDYLHEQGLHAPVMSGPNRPASRPAPVEDVEKFQRELVHKHRLQDQRRYRRLWWRKLVVESPRLARRYLEWFLVRILRIKSLTGQRSEVPSEQIRVFR